MFEKTPQKTPVLHKVALIILGTAVVTWILIPGESAPPPGRVTSSEYGDRWPLLASEATLGCEPPTQAYIEIAGRRCGINGKAFSAGMARCDEVAKDGNAASITSAFIDRALALCASRS